MHREYRDVGAPCILYVSTACPKKGELLFQPYHGVKRLLSLRLFKASKAGTVLSTFFGDHVFYLVETRPQ